MCAPAVTALATKEGFLSYLSACYEIPEAELTRSAEQAACSFEGKLLLNHKASVNYFSCCYCVPCFFVFFFTAADSVFTTATSALSHRDAVVSNASIKKIIIIKKKIVF